jgi:hypothetical protein
LLPYLLLLCPLAAKKLKPRPLLLPLRLLPLLLLLRPPLLLKPPSLLKLLHLLLPLRLLLKLPSLLKPLRLLLLKPRSNSSLSMKTGLLPRFFRPEFGELKKAPAGAFSITSKNYCSCW